VPDDIPRIAGVINANHTTPLSHTNVLATGWQIPNAIQIGVLEEIAAKQLDGQWVRYAVDMNSSRITLEKVDRPAEIPQRPSWSIQRIRLEEPETVNTPIVGLDRLRMSGRFRYGTKAANLGELFHVLAHGSERMLGFYKVRRPPRANLLPYLASHLGLPADADAHALAAAALDFLRAKIRIPRGIAIPFSVQQTVLESSPKVQQALGKLKMALELDRREIDAVCVQLQQMIRAIRIPDRIRDYIDSEIAGTLGGVSSFVVRSSSNAEDLENFSAAGMYESIIHVTTAEKLFQAIKDVWASQLSPRSVRFVHQAGISLDDCYMGVIVQEEASADIGGVLVTTNPMNRGDFRNVYVNVSAKSVGSVVHGEELPFQYLYNSVEGGGRTLSIGDAEKDLSDDRKALLQDLAFAGRLLQAHFSRDYTFAMPLDIEWVAGPDEEALVSPGDKAPPVLKIVQLRPYSK
ncbi:MAG: phosphoenolpyruvate synthase, partial [Deltaproteobacteria bacterium]|nr:phosphoenolpyruvate synthase [Deltaproteobacteria bacterium]